MIDRERQVRELRGLVGRERPRLALLTGRRRVGKTFLLDHAFSPFRTFYFLCGDTTADRNRRDLLRDLSAFLPDELVPEDYPTWRSVFRLLASLADDPLVVVLDEFQYLMEAEEGIVSQLVAVWDREVKDRPLTVALCGSRVTVMDRLRQGDSPLFGRIDWSERLEAFDYRDAAEMVPWLSRRDQVGAWGIFGGTPRYLAAADPGESLREFTVRTMLSPRGEVHLQLADLVEQERGIRSPAEYRAVLAAVASGRTRVSEILTGAGLGGGRTSALHVLETLEDLGLVGRERNFGAHRTAAWRYRIVDPAVRFWFRFVERHRSRLERGGEAGVWDDHVAPSLDAWLGHTFETVVQQAVHRFHAALGLPAPTEWARWEGADRNRRSIEIDLVVRTADGRMLTGDVKWSSRPVSQAVHHHLLRDLEALAASGQGWAKDAADADTTAGRLYVSAAGFDDAFRDLAGESAQIRLLDLDDLFR